MLYLDYWNNYDWGELIGDKRFLIMQYTGLKDNNDKEIYEGDILKKYSFQNWDPEHLTEVKFIKGAFMCETPKGLREDIVWPNHHEIVGNIYENPDLLTV